MLPRKKLSVKAPRVFRSRVNRGGPTTALQTLGKETLSEDSGVFRGPGDSVGGHQEPLKGSRELPKEVTQQNCHVWWHFDVFFGTEFSITKNWGKMNPF